MISIQRRFWRQVDKKGEDDCWVWLGNINASGYGRLGINYSRVLAHRYSLELAYGSPIDPDLDVAHLCHNPPCVNPKHLQEMTHQENLLMQERYMRETCVNGHERIPENVYISVGGKRDCLICRTERNRGQR